MFFLDQEALITKPQSAKQDRTGRDLSRARRILPRTGEWKNSFTPKMYITSIRSTDEINFWLFIKNSQIHCSFSSCDCYPTLDAATVATVACVQWPYFRVQFRVV